MQHYYDPTGRIYRELDAQFTYLFCLSPLGWFREDCDPYHDAAWESFKTELEEVIIPGFIINLDGEPLDIAQQLLGHAGVIPLVGNAFDVTNAAISLARGNEEDLIFYLAAAVPAAGVAVYASVRMNKGLQHVRQARNVKEAAELAKSSWGPTVTKSLRRADADGFVPHVDIDGVPHGQFRNMIFDYDYEIVNGRTTRASGYLHVRVTEELEGIPSTRNAKRFNRKYDDEYSLSSSAKAELKESAGISGSDPDWDTDHLFGKQFGGTHDRANIIVTHRDANQAKNRVEITLRSHLEGGDTVHLTVEPIGGVGAKPDEIRMTYTVTGLRGPKNNKVAVTQTYEVVIPNGPSARGVKPPNSLPLSAAAAAAVLDSSSGMDQHGASEEAGEPYSSADRSTTISSSGDSAGDSWYPVLTTGGSAQGWRAADGSECKTSHCRHLDTELSGATSGIYTVVCYSSLSASPFGTNTLHWPSSSLWAAGGCWYGYPGEQVWVEVTDRHGTTRRSNTVTWPYTTSEPDAGPVSLPHTNPVAAEETISIGPDPRSVSLSLGNPVAGATKQQYCADEPYCYWFAIDLHGDFGTGAHRYQCFTVGLAEPWVDWTTDGNPDRQCLYWHDRQQVFVIVDGIRSNTLTWSPPPDF